MLANKLTRIPQHRAKFHQHWPNLIEFGKNLANLNQNWHMLVKLWPNQAQIGQQVSQMRFFSNIGQPSPDICQIGPSSANFGRFVYQPWTHLADFERLLANSGRLRDNFGARRPRRR